MLDWSQIAQDAIVGRAGKFPGEAAVLMEIVHVAIYDAVVAIEGGSEPYAITPTVPVGASAEAAAATAAHGVLVGLLPGQQGGPDGLDATYSNYLATLPRGSARTGGRAVGLEVAAGILALRDGDGRNAVVPYVQPPQGPGVFEPVPPGSVPVGTNVGRIRPLTLPSPGCFRPSPPPALVSNQYAVDFNEVRRAAELTVPPRRPSRRRSPTSGETTASPSGTGRCSAWSTSGA